MSHYFKYDDGYLVLRKKIEDNSLWPLLVLIAGMSCSGKSFLAKKLAEEFGPVSQIPQDKFFRNLDDPAILKDGNGGLVFDTPEAYHMAEYKLAVSTLSWGKEIWLPEYSVSENRRIKEKGQKIEPHPIIIAEGLFTIQALRAACQNVISVFINTDLMVCANRRAKRDAETLGLPKSVVMEVFATKVIPYYQKYAKLQMRSADIVLI